MLQLTDVSVRDTLQNVNLRVTRGELVLVVGANGAGKSTLFSAISGSVRLDSGKIMLAGRDITELPQHKRAAMIASVLQSPQAGTVGEMTLLENLSIACARRGSVRVTKAVIDGFRARLAGLGMGLENRLSVRARDLSGGQRQLLSLIMAVSADYDLLLCDETTAALDRRAADRVVDFVKNVVMRESKTCLFITHDQRYINSLGDRAFEVSGGGLHELHRTDRGSA